MIRTVVLALVFLISSLHSFAQQNWAGGVDDETVHFGFAFQYISAEYKIMKKPNWRAPYYDQSSSAFVTDSLYSLSSQTSPGFGLGFVSNFRAGNYMDFRITPGLIFSDRLVNYTYGDPSKDIQKTVQATMVELPLSLKLKSERRKNFRAYLLGGVKYSADIGSKKKNNDADKIAIEKMVKNLRSYTSYEAGIGFDLYFEFFKLSPEIKLSNSFRSVLKPEDHPFSKPIDKLYLRNLQFSLYFE